MTPPGHAGRMGLESLGVAGLAALLVFGGAASILRAVSDRPVLSKVLQFVLGLAMLMVGLWIALTS